MREHEIGFVYNYNIVRKEIKLETGKTKKVKETESGN